MSVRQTQPGNRGMKALRNGERSAGLGESGWHMDTKELRGEELQGPRRNR